MKLIHANIVSNQTVFEAEVRFDNKIRSIKKLSDNINPKLDYLLPGFIDLHVHGGGGVDVMDQQDLDKILSTHIKFGTTSLLLTTVTATHSNLKNTFEKIAWKINHMQPSEAKILGIHLEGPYINPEKLGAQPAFTRNASLDEILELHKISPIKIMTIAPELMDSSLYQKLIEQNIIIQIGHSNGTYDEAVFALKAGAKSFTHLFNAMSGFHHRSPGVSGAALAHAEFSELIPDLLHVHPGAIKAALRSIPKLYFVTDSTSATGMPDGEFKLGTHTVTKCNNGVTLSDGTLAGSALSMLQALHNLTNDKIGLTLAEASYRLSNIPAELLGIHHSRGAIKEDLFSDLIVLDQSLNLKKVYLEGEEA